jgi:predicted patatin/cPLA2 family phospholipase
MSNTIENVLILQGGGSLGAFGCGVFKALANSNIKIDIIAGTSIGGLNASIIAGSKEDHPEKALEQFWLELAEGSANLNYPFIEWLARYPISAITPTASTPPLPTMDHSSTHIFQVKSTMSFMFQQFMEIIRSLYLDGALSSPLPIHNILHQINGHICMITHL